jgi:hypothetical protein
MKHFILQNNDRKIISIFNLVDAQNTQIDYKFLILFILN